MTTRSIGCWQIVRRCFHLRPQVQFDPRAEVKESLDQSAAAGPEGDPGPQTTLAAIAESEPNNTSATATLLTFSPAAIATAAINPGGDLDFYTFTAPAGSRVWIETDTGGTQNAGGTSRDTVMDLLAADGTTVIETDDDDGTGNGGNGTVEPTGLNDRWPHAGPRSQYFVRVRAFGCNGNCQSLPAVRLRLNRAATPSLRRTIPPRPRTSRDRRSAFGRHRRRR